jgi:hypothetical protein
MFPTFSCYFGYMVRRISWRSGIAGINLKIYNDLVHHRATDTEYSLGRNDDPQLMVELGEVIVRSLEEEGNS